MTGCREHDARLFAKGSNETERVRGLLAKAVVEHQVSSADVGARQMRYLKNDVHLLQSPPKLK
jgi:hypothetical protein